jgi:hypothetical protein
MCPERRKPTVDYMSTAHLSAPPAAAANPRARSTTVPRQQEQPHGATAAGRSNRRGPLSRTVRTVGIVLDTAARVVFLGRDGVRL